MNMQSLVLRYNISNQDNNVNHTGFLIYLTNTPPLTQSEAGQVQAIIIPVPKNQLSQPFLIPVFLDLPPVQHHDKASLAKLSKSVLE